ncbi:phosphatase PAP2 family protein [Paenibacillus hodogayensis]|uniref:Phosphatase PAP2 family protein n=1 Tax=Paenibacillus hodogayensis TaxID=279208 RepID=A0ABV5W0Q8_9BACL
MRAKVAGYMPLLWLLCIPVLNVCYGLLNREGPNVRSLMTIMDVHTPFVSYFIIPYLVWYPFMIGMFVLLFRKDAQVYYRTLVMLCVGLVVCYITYYFFQTVVSRPVVTDDVPLHMLVNLVYNTDQPYNCFPSIHVLTTYLIWKSTVQYITLSRKAHAVIGIVAWAIIVSTVFVKQHVVLDIVGAIVVVEMMAMAMRVLFPLRKKAPASVSA